MLRETFALSANSGADRDAEIQFAPILDAQVRCGERQQAPLTVVRDNYRNCPLRADNRRSEMPEVNPNAVAYPAKVSGGNLAP